MRAIRLHARGGPEQIVYEDAPLPAPAEGEALLRVHAAGITPTELTWSETYRTPDGRDRLPTIPGHDDGDVEALGPGVFDNGRIDGDPVDRADHLDDPAAQREEVLVEAGQGGRHRIQDQLAEPLAETLRSPKTRSKRGPSASISSNVSFTSETTTE